MASQGGGSSSYTFGHSTGNVSFPTQEDSVVGITLETGSFNSSPLYNISVINSTLLNYGMTPAYASGTSDGYSVLQLVIISMVSTLASIGIIACNCLVFLSFKINKKLHTVSNYFILSLAASDLLIGIFSTNLYTMYLLLDYWPLGTFVCDVWLSIDYVCCQASVFNLVVICVDRYLNLKRPFLHKVNRTAFKAKVIISIVWIGSMVTWVPLIISYQFIVGERTVRNNKCYVQFLSDSIPITFVTGMLTFYAPVATMIILYFKIYRLTTDRIRDFALMTLQFHIGSTVDFLTDKRRSKLKRHYSADNSVCRSKSVDLKIVKKAKLDKFSPADNEDETTNEKDTLTKCHLARPKRKQGISFKADSVMESLIPKKKSTSTLNPNDIPDAPKFLRKKSSSFDYSGLGLVPPGGLLGRIRSTSGGSQDLENSTPRVRKKSCSVDFTGMQVLYQKEPGKKKFKDTRSDSLFGRKDTLFSRRNTMLRRRGSVGKHRKAAKMVIFLLLAFISTWLLYNVLALIKPFCDSCIPRYLWHVSNWLCYINSLINPFCYAFGNREFRQSFRTLVGLGRNKLNKKLSFK